LVLPLLAGIGLAAQSAANDASDRSRSGLPPAVMSSCAACSVPTPRRANVRGAAAVTSSPSCVSSAAISVLSAATRTAMDATYEPDAEPAHLPWFGEQVDSQ